MSNRSVFLVFVCGNCESSDIITKENQTICKNPGCKCHNKPTQKIGLEYRRCHSCGEYHWQDLERKRKGECQTCNPNEIQEMAE